MDPAFYVAQHVPIPADSLPKPYSIPEDSDFELALQDPVEDMPLFCDTELLFDLQELQDKIGNAIAHLSREANAAEKLDEYFDKISCSRAFGKLAAIDRIYGVTESPADYLFQRDVDNFTALDIAAAPGGFIQYMEYRKPHMRGWAMSLESELAWKLNENEARRTSQGNAPFEILTGADKTGNIIRNASWLVDKIAQDIQGVRLVTADGSIDIGRNYKQQESLNFQLIAAEVILGICCTAYEGHCVVKLFNTVTSRSAQLLTLASYFFDSISLFKPYTSRPGNEEKYLVAKDRNRRNSEILRPVLKMLSEGKEIVSLVASIPDEMEEWLTQQNNLLLQAQYDFTLKAQKRMKPPPVDLDRLIIFWRLPGALA